MANLKSENGVGILGRMGDIILGGAGESHKRQDDEIELRDVINDDEGKTHDLRNSNIGILSKISDTLEDLEHGRAQNSDYTEEARIAIQDLKKKKREHFSNPVENLVAQIITPYIEEWLEKHLSDVVKKEVERVVNKIAQD